MNKRKPFFPDQTYEDPETGMIYCDTDCDLPDPEREEEFENQLQGS